MIDHVEKNFLLLSLQKEQKKLFCLQISLGISMSLHSLTEGVEKSVVTN